jgi:AhpD family alkylhydroperoxidase
VYAACDAAVQEELSLPSQPQMLLECGKPEQNPEKQMGKTMRRRHILAAGLAAAMVEDCGPCVQIHVNLALKDKVDAQVLRALVAGELDKVPPHVATAFRYGDAVSRGVMADELRDEIREAWGERGLIELAFTIATARFYPAVKRGMGYARTCERVVIEREETRAVKAA